MRLADFILANREPILVEWEAFARTCKPASTTMDVEALRDHADQMLTVIAADLNAPQDHAQQTEKSKGRADTEDADDSTAAEEHGAGRAESGYTVEQMVAEYRALRASVIRLWTKARGGVLAAADIEDLTRFNEAIDQALAESVAKFGVGLEQSKELFLGILGHDLRSPLGAISTSARFMVETGVLPQPHQMLTEQVEKSASRALEMVGALLDFTRGRLGGGIPIARAEINIGRVVRDAVDECLAAHPEGRIEVQTRGNELGEWDAARLSQALGNVLGNAVQHAARGTSVRVDVVGEGDRVAITVHNRGEAIHRDQLDGIFNPLKSRQASATSSSQGPTGSLGLGLYIADQIVSSHQGRIDVKSSQSDGTTFTIFLPRREISRAHQ